MAVEYKKRPCRLANTFQPDEVRAVLSLLSAIDEGRLDAARTMARSEAIHGLRRKMQSMWTKKLKWDASE